MIERRLTLAYQEISKIADVDVGLLAALENSKLTIFCNKVYISKPSDYPHQPSKLLLFLTSATGIHSKNNQLQADKFASEGFVVVAPDQYEDAFNLLIFMVVRASSNEFKDFLEMLSRTRPRNRPPSLTPTHR